MSHPHGVPIPWGTDELRSKLLEIYRKKCEQPYLSTLNDEHVREAFSHFVLQEVPMVVDGFFVSRMAWAKAFYESDMAQSAKRLFKALFTEKEMRDCTRSGYNNTRVLNPIKTLTILRVAKWMSFKYQDPYYFHPTLPGHNVYPTKEEHAKIEKDVFTDLASRSRKRFKAERHLSMKPMDDDECLGPLPRKTGQHQPMNEEYSPGEGELIIGLGQNGDNDEDLDSKSAASFPGGSGRSYGSPYSSCGSDRDMRRVMGGAGLGLFPFHEEMPIGSQSDFELDELQIAFIRHPNEFADTLFPNRKNKFIFIDGLLVDKDKWRKAFNEGSDPVKSAWTLFLAMFSTDEIIQQRTLHPVKKLAIIRAVKWMKQMQPFTLVNPKIWEEWHNEYEDCNSFPTEEEKENIEREVFIRATRKARLARKIKIVDKTKSRNV